MCLAIAGGQWLIEVLCFYFTFMLADSLVLLNVRHRKALNRLWQLIQTPKMADRILRDIRFYESEKPNIEGQSMPNELGKLFIPTKDTNYIGQRIARKLNELKFTYG